MAGLPNFGSSFADALLSTMGALDARKKAQAEQVEVERRNRVFDTFETAGNVYQGEGTEGLLDQKGYDKLVKQQAKEAKRAKGAVPAAMQTPATPVPVPDVTAPGATPAAPQAAMTAPSAPAAPADTQFIQDFDATFAPRQKAGMPAAQPAAELPPVAAQAPATTTEKVPVDAAQTGPAVKGPDDKKYYKVMVGDKVMYAPADRVKRLSGPDLYKAQADALDRIDPVQAAALRKTVIGMEKDNIELSTMKMAQGVQVAKAAAANGDWAGFANALATTYNQAVPDSMQATVVNDPQQGPVLVRKDVSGMTISQTPLNGVDPSTGMRNADMLMAQAEALTTTSGMTSWLKSVADMRTNVITNAFNQAKTAQTEQQTKQEKELFPLEVAEKKARIAATNRSNRGSAGGSGDGRYGVPTSMPVYGTDADGNRVQVGQDIVRKGKDGRIEALSTGFGEYMPYGYDWDRMATDMRRQGGKLGLQVGIDEKTGLPAYRAIKSGKVTPISANTLESYRRK